ncbi:MAG: hypothetical protein A2284_14585 [Deltaproteobacteria bacterium RIFOXYA12_FULL_61_11]|nr:MAG: hypothetical protein A2284_14585 [Deltaproteobacteria bacterium RIFOXYA12_FULL_61_11]
MTAKRILLVDDEPDALEFLQDVLEDHGYQTVTATSATQGLSLAREHCPDLVCLDVLMPEETGMSLFQKLRLDPVLQHVPIIITSGLSLTRDLEQIQYRNLPDGTILDGPEGVVEKPIEVETLLRTIARVLP